MKMTNEKSFNDFIHAQNTLYPSVLAELTQGRKRTHWMWFIFPQIVGLGRSTMAQRFALADVAQAEAYLQHEVLGARLIECATLLQRHSDKSALEIFAFTSGIMRYKAALSFTTSWYWYSTPASSSIFLAFTQNGQVALP